MSINVHVPKWLSCFWMSTSKSPHKNSVLFLWIFPKICSTFSQKDPILDPGLLVIVRNLLHYFCVLLLILLLHIPKYHFLIKVNFGLVNSLCFYRHIWPPHLKQLFNQF